MPTSWVARYGSGHPIIALGTDIDGLPSTNQTPGVVTRKELVPGAPGHGEGHNAGQALIMTAALAVKKIMDRDKLPGTLMIWPGVAEEALGTKAHFVRAGVFKDVDAVLFVHVGSTWARAGARAAAAAWCRSSTPSRARARTPRPRPGAGKSALDAVELMDIAWNFKREHLRTQQRSHYVITNGGDQPNVVPPNAIGLVLLPRDRLRPHQGAVGSRRHDGQGRGDDDRHDLEFARARLGLAAARNRRWPRRCTQHPGGRPAAVERSRPAVRARRCSGMGVQERGLSTTWPLSGRVSIPDDEKTGGASDDIGDIMWSVPTVRLSFPSNIPGATGHHWTSAVSMATPVAHKGATQGAKVEAMTIWTC